MRPILQCITIIAVLMCGSHKLGTQAVSVYGYNSGMGPYDIQVEVIRACDDPGTQGENYHLYPYTTKVDGVSKILYRVELTQPVTQDVYDNLDATILIYRKKNHKEFLMLNYTDNLCKTVTGNFKQVYYDFRVLLGLEGEGCYIPQGTYTATGWGVDARLPPPVLGYGNYRAIVELLDDHKRFGCVEVIAVAKQKA